MAEAGAAGADGATPPAPPTEEQQQQQAAEAATTTPTTEEEGGAEAKSSLDPMAKSWGQDDDDTDEEEDGQVAEAAGDAAVKGDGEGEGEEDEEGEEEGEGEGDGEGDVDVMAVGMSMLQLDAEDEEARRRHLRRLQGEGASHLSSSVSFDDLGIPQPLLDTIKFDMKFEQPSDIQRRAIPEILQRKNVIAQAHTGAGKTVAFAIGMLSAVDPNVRKPQALCIAPTRELATQTYEDALTVMSQRMENVQCQLLVRGDAPKGGRGGGGGAGGGAAGARAPREPVTAQVLVGTAGTVLGMMVSKNRRRPPLLDARQLKVFVLDEADDMVRDEQARNESEAIRNQLPRECQKLLFSATFPPHIMDFAKHYIGGPAVVMTLASPKALVLEEVAQVWIDTRGHPGGKLGALQEIYDFLHIQQSIVFVTTREGANSVARTMNEKGFPVSNLHGGLDGPQRDATLHAFRSKETKILIATKVLARGIDVPSVAVVVNFELPLAYPRRDADTEQYLHRIGRTGRFGRSGIAISFVDSDEDLRVLQEIDSFYRTGDEPLIKQWSVQNIVGLGELYQQRKRAAAQEQEGGEAAAAAAPAPPAGPPPVQQNAA